MNQIFKVASKPAAISKSASPEAQRPNFITRNPHISTLLQLSTFQSQSFHYPDADSDHSDHPSAMPQDYPNPSSGQNRIQNPLSQSHDKILGRQIFQQNVKETGHSCQNGHKSTRELQCCPSGSHLNAISSDQGSQNVDNNQQENRAQHEQFFEEGEELGFIYFQSEVTFAGFLEEFQDSTFEFMEVHGVTFCEQFRFILQHWSLYKHTFQNQVEQFVDLAYFKVFRIAYSEELYHQLFHLVISAQEIMNYRGYRDRVKSDIKTHNLDSYFQHYINQLRTRHSRNGRYIIVTDEGGPTENREEIIDLINKEDAFSRPPWNSLFERVTDIIKNKRQFGEHFGQEMQAKQEIDSTLYKRDVVSSGNIMNASFFHTKSNIYDPTIDNSLISLGGFINNLDDQEASTRFLEEMLGLLNSRGGVILFDARKRNYQVQPIGQFMLESRKLQIRHKINELIKSIEPAIATGLDFSIDFIPIVSNPYLFQAEQNGLEFKEGFYVTAVKVSQQPHLDQFVFKKGEKTFCFEKRRSIQPAFLDPTYNISQENRHFQQKLRQMRGKQTERSTPSKGNTFVLPYRDQSYAQHASCIQDYNRELQELEKDVPFSSEIIESINLQAHFQPLQPSGYACLRKKIVTLGNQNKNELYEIFKYLYHSSKGKKMTKIFNQLSHFQCLLSQLAQLLEKTYWDYNLDLNKFLALNMRPEQVAENVSHQYSAILNRREKEFNILVQYHFILQDIWKNRYFFQSYYTQEDPPLKGCPLTFFTPKKERDYEELQRSYPFCSFLACRKQDIKTVLLKLWKYNIDCEAKSMPDRKIKGCATTWVIYHKNPHRQIQETINHKKQFKFNGRQLLTFPVSNFIKLEKQDVNPLEQEEFDDISQWLRKDFPKETLHEWKCKSEKGSHYYLSTESWMSTVFIYLVILFFEEKGFLKDPEGVYDRNTSHQQMTLIFKTKK